MEEKLKDIKIKDNIAQNSQASTWGSLEQKYINYNKKDMQNENSAGRTLNARPKWLTSVLISLGIILVLAIPTSAYFAIPTVKETVDGILKINTEKSGTLVVNTTPDGVSVFVNGEYQGDSPFTMTLPVGNYSIGLYKDTYQEKFETVSITQGQSTTLTDSLTSLSIDQYQGWFTYKNESLGLGFRYPNTWTISESGDSNTHVISLSYTDTSTNQKLFDYSLTYKAANIKSYDASNLTIEETADDDANAVKILTRKVGTVVIDTLTLVNNSAKNISLTNDQLALNDLFVDSVSFVNRTSTGTNTGTGTGTNTSTSNYQYSAKTFVKAPQSSEGNYLLMDYGNDSTEKLLNVSSKTVKDVSYGIPTKKLPLTDPSGKFIVYDQNDTVFAKDIANGKTVQLFQVKSDSEANFYFQLDAISPDSRYLVYDVQIRDTSGGDGQEISSKNGWKTGIYLYDLQGELGNVYLDNQPFDYTYYSSGTSYNVDWTKDSMCFYIQDLRSSKIYKYQFRTAGFQSFGSYQLDTTSHYGYLDMWGNGNYSASDNMGVLLVKSSDYKTVELWQVADNGTGNTVKIEKVKSINISSIISTTGALSNYHFITLNNKPYLFFNNSVWMYSITEDKWQGFKYLQAADVNSAVSYTKRYYPTNASNIVLAIDNASSTQDQNCVINLFDPIAMTAPVSIALNGANYDLRPNSLY